MRTKSGTIRGVLSFHSETGTEGGYWAFQDERFIQKNVPRGYCKKCGKWLRDQKGALMVLSVDEISVDEATGEFKAPRRPECIPDAHEEAIGDAWSYEGLYPLKDGDHLKIFSKENPDQVVWEGTIQLREYPVFTEHVLGMWIHADQVKVNRETWARWFMDGYPAELDTLRTR